MIQLSLVPGHGRRWSGTEFVELQKEPLDILQGFFGNPGAAAALSGIEVTGSDISAGLAVIKHADGWKVVRVPAVTGATFPYYFQVSKTNNSKLYNDLSTQIVNSTYTATSATPGGSPATDIYLKVTADGAIRWEDVQGVKSSSPWVPWTLFGAVTGYSFTGTGDMRRDRLGDSVHLRGYIDLNLVSGTPADITLQDVILSLSDLLPGATFSSEYIFSCPLDYDYNSGFVVDTVGERIQFLNAKVTTAGELKLWVVKPDTGIVTGYRIIVDHVIPMG